jgi:hypothetical protein
MLIQLYFSVNMLYIFKIERNNSIHSSVAVVNYLLVPPIIPYRDRACQKKFYKILNYRFAVITYLDAEVTSFNSFIRAYIVKRLLGCYWFV